MNNHYQPLLQFVSSTKTMFLNRLLQYESNDDNDTNVEHGGTTPTRISSLVSNDNNDDMAMLITIVFVMTILLLLFIILQKYYNLIVSFQLDVTFEMEDDTNNSSNSNKNNKNNKNTNDNTDYDLDECNSIATQQKYQQLKTKLLPNSNNSNSCCDSDSDSDNEDDNVVDNTNNNYDLLYVVIQSKLPDDFNDKNSHFDDDDNDNYYDSHSTYAYKLYDDDIDDDMPLIEYLA
jgi:hypothetical protein